MGEVVLPHDLVGSLEAVKGFDRDAFLDTHHSGNQVVSVRYNPFKTNAGNDHFAGSEPVPWCSTGYYLPARPSFTLDPWLHAGAYYVQEASSMFLEQCLRQCVDLSKPLRVLDLCAAPGGKSTLIQSLLSADSLLVSNEVIKGRVGVLSENLVKWGGVNTVVTSNDPRDFNRLESYFDVMIVDAPCSGSGLFRRDPDAVREWSPEAVEMCSQRQQRILTDAYSALKAEGILVYSTCSYSIEENEEVCDWLVNQFDLSSMPLKIDSSWGIVEALSPVKGVAGYRFFPDKVKGEGFFIACFRNNGGGSGPDDVKKGRLTGVTMREREIIQPWIGGGTQLNYYHHNDAVLAFPASLQNDLARISVTLYLKRAGFICGKLAQGALVPDHELAMTNLARTAVAAISLKKEQALQYLRKDEVSMEYKGKGWALVQYEELTLGWVKLLVNRINNYYPKEWRILKSINS